MKFGKIKTGNKCHNNHKRINKMENARKFNTVTLITRTQHTGWQRSHWIIQCFIPLWNFFWRYGSVSYSLQWYQMQV